VTRAVKPRINLTARAANAEIRRAQTRARLASGALEVLAARTPALPTVEDLASAAGVSRGTFYNYYPTPEALVAELRQEIREQAAARFDQILSVTDDPAIQTALIVRHYLHFAADAPLHAAAFLHIEDLHGLGEPLPYTQFRLVMDRGLQTGRFAELNRYAVRTLIFGTVRMTMRDLLRGSYAPGSDVRVTAMILAALGLPHAEADLIAAEVARTAPHPHL
jgi:AcrR family transcriptional regulator